MGEKVSLRTQCFRQEGKLGRGEGRAPHRKPRQGGGDPFPPLFGLQRTDGIDQPPPRPQQCDRRIEQSVLEGGERGKIGGTAEMRDVGVAADGAGATAGGVEQHRIEPLLLPPGGGVGHDHPGGKAKTGKVVAQPSDAPLVAIDGGHSGSGRGKLGGLAAGGGTEIGDPLTRAGGEKTDGQRGGDILDEEAPLREAGQRGNGRSRRQAPGA